MPRANWEVSPRDVRNFDRSKQFKPYTGPMPTFGTVYQFLIKQLKFSPSTTEKLPQLRIGLELSPRRKDEKRFAGFFVMSFRSVANNTQFAYVPFLDAIGVSETDFTNRTVTDEEGNIKRIGNWRNDGKQYVMAQLKDSDNGKGGTRPDVGWIGAVEDVNTDEDEDDDGTEFDDELDEEIDEDELDEEDEEEEEPEEEVRPARKARPTGRTNARRSAPAPTRKRRQAEEDPF